MATLYWRLWVKVYSKSITLSQIFHSYDSVRRNLWASSDQGGVNYTFYVFKEGQFCILTPQ